MPDIKIERRTNGDAILIATSGKGMDFVRDVIRRFGRGAIVGGGVYCEGSRSEDYVNAGIDEAEAFGCTVRR